LVLGAARRTAKRFYRLLHHPSFQDSTTRRWLVDRGTQHWDSAANELVLIDGPEVIKPYAVRMEYLARVPNPLTKQGEPWTMPGYLLRAAVRTTLAKGMAQVLNWRVWSTREPGFCSENQITQQFLDRLLARVGRRAVLVLGRGFGCLRSWAGWRHSRPGSSCG
jgi:hypothetical protein